MNQAEIIDLCNLRVFKVLEIGGGHNPDPRSQIIIDKYSENKERGGDLVTDRPVIIANAEDLGFFHDKIFDFVIARHVLEHSDDPAKMLNEMERVGKAGYIETPSELAERLNAKKSYHKWLVNVIDGKLVLKPKRDEDYFGLGLLLDYLFKNNVDFRRLFMSTEKLWYVKYHWNGKIEFELRPPSPRLELDFCKPELVAEYCSVSFAGRLKGSLNPRYYIQIKSILRRASKILLLAR